MKTGAKRRFFLLTFFSFYGKIEFDLQIDEQMNLLIRILKEIPYEKNT